MGIWVGSPLLEGVEKLRWKRAANHTQGNRAVGGRLFMTNQRLIFQPNRLDAATKGLQWSVRLRDVQSVGKEDRDMNPFSGGLRNRLRVHDAHGSELFVVRHLDEVIELLETAVAAAK
jgi:hypothetical protein